MYARLLKKSKVFSFVLLFILIKVLFVSCGTDAINLLGTDQIASDGELLVPSVKAAKTQVPSSIQLIWSLDTGASYYEIYRDVSISASFDTLLASVALSTYIDGLEKSGVYYYRVRACTENVCSALSQSTSPIDISSDEISLNRVSGRYSVQISFTENPGFTNLDSERNIYLALYDRDNIIGEITNTKIADLDFSENTLFVSLADLQYERLYLFPGVYRFRLYIGNAGEQDVFSSGTLFATDEIFVTNKDVKIQLDESDFTSFYAVNLNVYLETESHDPLPSTVRNKFLGYNIICRVDLNDYNSINALILDGLLVESPKFVSVTPVESSRFRALPEENYNFICFIDLDDNGVLSDLEESSYSISGDNLSVSFSESTGDLFIPIVIDPEVIQESQSTREIVSDGISFDLSEPPFVESYNIYRRGDDASEFVLIASISAVNGDASYIDEDVSPSTVEQTYTYLIVTCVTTTTSTPNCLGLDQTSEDEVITVVIPTFADGFLVSQMLESYIANLDGSVHVYFNFEGDGFVSNYLLFDSADNLLLNESDNQDIFLNFDNAFSSESYSFKICNYNIDPILCSDPYQINITLPYIVAPVLDIRPDGDALLNNLIIFEDRLFFTGNDGVFGEELWSYNYESPLTDTIGLCSSSLNPCLVQDLAVRQIISGFPRHSYPSSLLAFSDSLYFSAFQEDTGAELYRYTSASGGGIGGISLVEDIAPGQIFLSLGDEIHPEESSPEELFVDGDKIYFSVVTSQYGREPWVYDTNTGSISLLVDLNYLGYSSDPKEFTKLGEYIYFTASAQVIEGVNRVNTGKELWRYSPSDATTASFKLCSQEVFEDGSSKVSNPCLTEEIVSGELGSSINELKTFGSDTNKLYFTASTEGVEGDSLWYYDASLEITNSRPRMNRFLMLNPQGTSNSIESLTLYSSSTMFFVGYFAGYPNLSDTNIGKEIWKLDVALEISNTLTDCLSDNQSNPCYIDIRSDSSLYLFPEDLFIKDDKLFFEARYGIYERELWVYDINLGIDLDNTNFSPFCSSSNYNPCLLADINEGAYSSFPSDFVSTVGLDRIFFTIGEGRSIWEIRQ